MGVGGEPVEVVQAGVGDPDGIKIGAIAGHILRIGKIKKDENLIRVNQMPKECGNLLLVCGNTFAKAVWVWVVLCIKEGQTVDFTRIIEDVQRTLNLVLVYHTPLQLSQRCGLVRQAVPGDILVINPGETHAIPEREPDSRYACLIPHQTLCSKMGLSVKDHPIKNLIQDEKSASAVHQILHILQEKPQLYEIDVQLRLISLVLYLIREYPKSDSISGRIRETAGEQLVKQAIRCIQENYARPLSTKDVCKDLGFDKTYVCSVFKKITGTTMISYLNMVRCEHARELLQVGKLSVEECASMSGFQNSSYFTKTYKHYTGELPSETARANSSQ